MELGEYLLAMIPLVCYSMICMNRLPILLRGSRIGYDMSVCTELHILNHDSFYRRKRIGVEILMYIARCSVSGQWDR